MGALRMDKMIKIEVSDIEQHGNLLLINIPNTKNKQPKSFTISGKFYELVIQYMSLRPSNVPHQRFFLNYQRQKCTIQLIKKNKFASMPKEIAKFLNLPDTDLYTG